MSTPRNLWAEETGAVLAEYALLAGLIAGVGVLAVRGLGLIVAAKFQGGAEAFASGPASTGPSPAAPGGGPAPAPPGGKPPSVVQ